jgi:mono/diheme cytochrome c family protein
VLSRVIILAAAIIAVACVACWVVTAPTVVAATELGPYQTNMENGRTMFYVGGCTACHAQPGQDDKTRLGGGMALKSPFGTFYVPNISPDPHDGIGAWSEADFVTALTKGTSPDQRHYYPAFPYTSYQRMRIEDVRDLFAFIKTLPPVTGKVRDHDLPFPFNVRRLVGVWKLLFLDGQPFRPDPTKSPEFNRGAYLVNGPGHCAECHSPRNLLGAIVAGQRFAGGPNPEGKGWIPNITQQRLKDWSETDIAYLLETGLTPDGDSVGEGMAAVVRNTSQISAQDRGAMALYIKSLAPVEGPKPPPKK